MDQADRSALAALPRIDALVDSAAELVQQYGRGAATQALRAAVDSVRDEILGGRTAAATTQEVVAAAAADLGSRRPGPPRAVINATGVVIHTNLGRAALSEAAIAAAVEAAGPCDVEIDLDSGERGSRLARVAPLLAEATGADAGIAVNNGAAALVLVLAALAAGREVLVSRGELVEIGGSFRLPQIMGAAGVRLVEVGTTNKTRASDYESGDDVALLLKVHPSNFRISGFTAQADVAQMAAVARRRGVPLVHDVGSGLLTDRPEPWFADEPSVRASLDAGADLVVCSGDKLLGGPQAGLIVGRGDLVAACARHPLARGLRLDKLRIAALVATLEAHLRGTLDELPVWRALTADAADLHTRSTAVAQELGGDVVEGASLVGGGSAPGSGIPTPVVRVPAASPSAAAARLRAGDPPLVLRIADGVLLIDLRTVPREADAVVTALVRAALHT